MNDNSNICPNCGAENVSEAVFCEKCGEMLGKSCYCIKCGEKIEKGMKFCPKCGKALYKREVLINNEREPVENRKVKVNSVKVAATIAAIVLIVGIIIVSILAYNDKPNFQKAFEQAGGENVIGEWVSVSHDGRSLRIDTNPSNTEDYYESDALVAIRKIHKALQLPDALITKMTGTRAIDGRQTANYDHIVVSWTYHPNYGLEIIYERR